MKMKKVVAILLTVVILGGAATGGIVGYKAYQKKNAVVEVQQVSNLSYGYWGDENTSSGMVTNDSSQEIYLSDSKTVSEVYVKEGDTVEVGDPLMAYDTAEVGIQIKQKELDISTIDNDIAIAQHNLDVLKNTTPVDKTKPVTPDTNTNVVPTPDVTPQPDVMPAGPEKSETGAYHYVTENSVPSNQADAPDGVATPYQFLCSRDAYVMGSYLNALIANHTTAVFEVRQGDSQTGNIITSWTVNGAYLETSYDADAKYYIATHDKAEEADDGTDTGMDEMIPEETVVDEWVEPEGYTADELAKEIAKQQATLKTLDIKKRKAQLELESLKQTSDDGTVYATVSGVVKTASDPDEYVNDGTAFLVVSGSDGLYVTGSVSELLLDQVGVGTVVTANSWESGMSFEAVITEIADYPQESDGYYGDGNSNASYYQYTAYIEDTTGLKNGEYLDLSITTGADTSDALYIEKAYIREEDGKSYVMAANGEDKLEKRYVTTGKTIYGSAVEITSGLSMDDRIAFPYGKNAVEGASVTEASNMY